MAACWYCKTKKGKRYCAPIGNLLCPGCCGENRLKKIDCMEDCRYLEGVAFQKKREDEKAFSKLLESVPHGQYDDIFHDQGVAFMAGEIETFVRDIYVAGNIRITDQIVYESYKRIYQIYFNDHPPEEGLDEFTQELMKFYSSHISLWKFNMERNKIGQVFLRLMISVKKMSGDRFGEFGYLNYLKNNLGNMNSKGQFIAEDKFGNKMLRSIKD